MSPDDTDLIRRFVAQRAEHALEELIRRHVDLVYRAALRKVGHPHLAEDVTQAVFTALAWKAPSLQRHRTIVGWLHTATRFAANETLRAERRRRRHEQEAVAMHEHSIETAAPVDWERLRPVIDDALGELKDSDREAVLLRFFADRPFTEIGAALGVSENTARMRVDRALDKLDALLARRGITSTSTALAIALGAHATAAAAPTALAASVTGAALASCTAATGAAATTTIIMSGSKIQVSLVMAAGLVLGIAVYESRVAGRLEQQSAIAHASVAAAIARQATLERVLQDAQGEQAALQQKIAASRAKLSGASPAAATAPAAESQMEILRDRYLQRRAVERSDPEYQRLHAAQRRLHLGQHYGPLYPRLKMPADRIAAFETLMAEHAQTVFDIEAAAETKRVTPWDSSVEKLKAAAKDRLNEDLRKLLGEENYAVFQRFEQTSALRSGVTGILAIALYPTATPLSAIQAERLTEILDRHARFERDGSKDAGGVDWPAALADAERVLAPAQFEALRGVYAQRRWNDTLATALGPMVGTQPPKQ
jgi:RNA polymerase sigma factor (sigma-70 family)